jgi:hypothetical protein
MKHYTRGGQITLHNMRMFIQIRNKVTVVTAIIFFLVAGSIAWFTISDYERYVGGKYLWSTVIPLLDEKAQTDFIQPNGEKIKVKFTDINEATLVKKIKY